MIKSLYSFAVLLCLFLFCRPLLAIENGGSFAVSLTKISDGGVTINSLAKIHVIWKTGTLMGEPLVNSSGAIIIPRRNSYKVKYQGKSYLVPFAVVDKISAVSVSVEASVGDSTYLQLDLGAMGETYFGDYNSFVILQKIDDYLSFNVAGSPDWAQLYYQKRNIGTTDAYLSKEAAVALFKTDHKVSAMFSTANIEFNLNEVRNWIENSRKINKKNKNSNAKSKSLAKKLASENLNKTEKSSSSLKSSVADKFNKKNDPFDKFNKFNEEEKYAGLEKIDKEIHNYIVNEIGPYYNRVEKSGTGLTLTAKYLGETNSQDQQRKQKEARYIRKKKIADTKAKKNALVELSKRQTRWKKQLVAIKGACRNYIVQKHADHASIEDINKLIEKNFNETDRFNHTYYY
ncbi:MAG: hypothetical protein GY787_23680 [Alteromonadales bacterium]|nr:hypothetical protein [Alteromonadales bacterium]